MREGGGPIGKRRGREPGAEERVYSVSEVTSLVKEVLESALPLFWVEGEISNFVHHRSGHMYFSLKDEECRLPAVMFKFRNRGLDFEPEDGMKVVAWGQVRVYEPAGKYQLYVEQMRPAGIGDLAAAFEKLKSRLAAEGLFDPSRKRPVPAFPSTVAVVTSPSGAAVRDVIRVVRARAPWIRLVVAPAAVQGKKAAPEIARAIRLIDQWGGADVMIVGRGGGSLEDLWAFNEETVARAIADSKTPVVSAVGHEIDYTIADFVADVRAATPSNAGELVAPDAGELRRGVATSLERIEAALARWVESRRDRLDACMRAYGMRAPARLVERFSERVDGLVGRLGARVRDRLEIARGRVDRVRAELRLSDPANILARGFAVVELLPELATVRSVTDVREGDGVRVRVADGSFECVVGEVTDEGRQSKGRSET
ncbi:MAG: exodeoxyribonuclease VII large subunit [Candidatus Eisenbacteria bacterium]|nr:exodeoxyribonuclease VII large subunit [Candidatus Eisenbacteria bacterium]